jgi:hypothetical protein
MPAEIEVTQPDGSSETPALDELEAEDKQAAEPEDTTDEAEAAPA